MINIKDKFRQTLFHHTIIFAIVATIVHFLLRILKRWDSLSEQASALAKHLQDQIVLYELVLTVVAVGIYFVFLFLKDNFIKAEAARGAGLFMYYPDQASMISSTAFEHFKDAGRKAQNITILGATGWDTFGKVDSPLHEALTNCRSARIILFNPLSFDLEQRAGNLTMTPETYRDEIYNSIRCLREMMVRAGDDKIIELKFFHRYPTWKFINIDGLLWVQRYPKDSHVQFAPCFAFEVTEQRNSLYDPFVVHLDSLWRSHRLGRYNFDTGSVTGADGIPVEIAPPEVIATLV